MLHSMSWTALSVVIMLLLMSVISIVLAVERGLRYSVARNQSRTFVLQVAAALDQGKLDDILSIAERNKKSPIAALVATGLAEFQLAPRHVPTTEMIEAAPRALEHSLGQLVAVPAVWCDNYFTSTVEGFDVEMENSSMELVSYLVRLEQRK